MRLLFFCIVVLLLLWPVVAALIVWIRFSLTPNEAAHLDLMQKWGGD